MSTQVPLRAPAIIAEGALATPNVDPPVRQDCAEESGTDSNGKCPIFGRARDSTVRAISPARNVAVVGQPANRTEVGLNIGPAPRRVAVGVGVALTLTSKGRISCANGTSALDPGRYIAPTAGARGT